MSNVHVLPLRRWPRWPSTRGPPCRPGNSVRPSARMRRSSHLPAGSSSSGGPRKSSSWTIAICAPRSWPTRPPAPGPARPRQGSAPESAAHLCLDRARIVPGAIAERSSGPRSARQLALAPVAISSLSYDRGRAVGQRPSCAQRPPADEARESAQNASPRRSPPCARRSSPWCCPPRSTRRARPGSSRFALITDDRDPPLRVVAADLLSRREARNAIADDHIVGGVITHLLASPTRLPPSVPTAGTSASLNSGAKDSQQVTHSQAIPSAPFSATTASFSCATGD
jgi:hypothetical protein